MTETITTGDIVNYGHDVHKLHETKRGANTLATVLGIVGAVIVIAILWNLFVRKNVTDKTTEKNTDITLGGNTEAINGLRHEVARLGSYERQDFGKIMFTDGLLYGGYYEHDRDCGCGERRHKGHCGQKFQEVATYNLATTTLNKTSNCDC